VPAARPTDALSASPANETGATSARRRSARHPSEIEAEDRGLRPRDGYCTLNVPAFTRSSLSLGPDFTFMR